VVAATPFVSLNDRISVGNGKEQDISILGCTGIQSGAELSGAGGPVLRYTGLAEPQQGWRDYGKTGDQAVWIAGERGGPHDQAERFAVYRDRSVQGAVETFGNRKWKTTPWRSLTR